MRRAHKTLAEDILIKLPTNNFTFYLFKKVQIVKGVYHVKLIYYIIKKQYFEDSVTFEFMTSFKQRF